LSIGGFLGGSFFRCAWSSNLSGSVTRLSLNELASLIIGACRDRRSLLDWTDWL
jgi:hypothetical protein